MKATPRAAMRSILCFEYECLNKARHATLRAGLQSDLHATSGKAQRFLAEPASDEPSRTGSKLAVTMLRKQPIVRLQSGAFAGAFRSKPSAARIASSDRAAAPTFRDRLWILFYSLHSMPAMQSWALHVGELSVVWREQVGTAPTVHAQTSSRARRAAWGLSVDPVWSWSNTCVPCIPAAVAATAHLRRHRCGFVWNGPVLSGLEYVVWILGACTKNLNDARVGKAGSATTSNALNWTSEAPQGYRQTIRVMDLRC